jgi:hypothetical protein
VQRPVPTINCGEGQGRTTMRVGRRRRVEVRTQTSDLKSRARFQSELEIPSRSSNTTRRAITSLIAPTIIPQSLSAIYCADWTSLSARFIALTRLVLFVIFASPHNLLHENTPWILDHRLPRLVLSLSHRVFSEIPKAHLSDIVIVLFVCGHLQTFSLPAPPATPTN